MASLSHILKLALFRLKLIELLSVISRRQQDAFRKKAAKERKEEQSKNAESKSPAVNVHSMFAS